MYPGKLIWAWGVLALGAGALLLSGLQWWTESTIRPESGGSAKSIPIDESASNSPERSATDGIVFEPREIGGDRRWKRSTRLDPCDDGSMIEETSADYVVYDKQRVLSINIDDRRIDGDELSRQNLRANEGDGTLDESSERDRHPAIIRADAHLNTEIRASDENKPDRFAERKKPRYKKGSDRAVIDIVTSPALRNDRFKEDIAVETGSRSKSKDRRGSRIDVVSRNAQAPGSREANINADRYLRSSTLMPRRHIRNSKRTGNHRVSRIDASTSRSGDRKGILEMREKNGRSGDQYESLDPHISQITGAIMEIKEEIAPALSRSIINDRDIESPQEAEETSRSSSGKPAMILGSSEQNTAEGDARQFAAGMQEDRLLFFRGDRERVQSSAMSPAEAIRDRKNWSEEQDRGGPARERREMSHDWFARTSNRSQNFRGRHDGIYHEEIFESHEQNDENNKYNGRKTDYHKNDRKKSQNIFSKGLNSSVDDELRDESDDGRSSGDKSAFQFLDSVIPPDNKRRKVTRGEDLKDLMVTSNFIWTSQDQEIKALVPEHQPTFSRDSRKTSHNGSARKRIRSAARRGDARGEHRGRTGETGSAAVRKADRRETASDERRKRYANYYSAQSATPMAYVHIQPAYPATPPTTNRKCLQCMVVYKRPCPSQSRPPPRIVLPSYRYHEPAAKWRGLKYGE